MQLLEISFSFNYDFGWVYHYKVVINNIVNRFSHVSMLCYAMLCYAMLCYAMLCCQIHGFSLFEFYCICI